MRSEKPEHRWIDGGYLYVLFTQICAHLASNTMPRGSLLLTGDMLLEAVMNPSQGATAKASE